MVSTLYRFDTRSPGEIFVSGFHSRGNDRDLASHFMSLTHEDGTSGFVATTSSFAAAIKYAEGYMIQPGAISQAGYIYRIQANAHCYDVAASMREHLHYLRAGGYADSLSNYVQRVESDLRGFTWEREYVADAFIPGNAILDATPVSGRRAANGEMSIVQGPAQANPFCIVWDACTNPVPYPVMRPPEDFSPCSSPSLSDLSSDEERAAGHARATGGGAAQIGWPCVQHAPRMRR